jgi:hypothetical protein
MFLVGSAPICPVRLLPLNKEKSLTVSQYLLLLPVVTLFIIVRDLLLYNHDLTPYLKEKILKRLHMHRNLN